MKDQIEVKLGAREMRVMKNLTNALDRLANYMQMYKPQKPKNSEIRLTEENNELQQAVEEAERLTDKAQEAISSINLKATGGYTGSGEEYAVRVEDGCYIPTPVELSPETIKRLEELMESSLESTERRPRPRLGGN